MELMYNYDSADPKASESIKKHRESCAKAHSKRKSKRKK